MILLDMDSRDFSVSNLFATRKLDVIPPAIRWSRHTRLQMMYCANFVDVDLVCDYLYKLVIIILMYNVVNNLCKIILGE